MRVVIRYCGIGRRVQEAGVERRRLTRRGGRGGGEGEGSVSGVETVRVENLTVEHNVNIS